MAAAADMHAPPPRAPVAPPGVITRLRVDDEEGIRSALVTSGCCVVAGAATPDEVALGKDLFWRYVEGTGHSIFRDDPATLGNESWNNLCFPKNGVISKNGIGQSDFLWHCRLLPGVRSAFAAAWNNSDLITSFDGAGAYRNPWASGDSGVPDASWLTTGGWFHLDQSWHANPGLTSYQGILSLLPANGATGATVLVPGSHRRFADVFASGKRAIKKVRQGSVDYVKLTQPGDADTLCAGAVQVEMEPGDLLLWDSRVIHCAQGVDLAAGPDAIGALPQLGEGQSEASTALADAGGSAPLLARISAYICMVPRAHLRRVKGGRALRRQYVEKGWTGGHSPLVVAPGVDAADAKYVAPPMDSPRWSLV